MNLLEFQFIFIMQFCLYSHLNWINDLEWQEELNEMQFPKILRNL